MRSDWRLFLFVLLLSAGCSNPVASGDGNTVDAAEDLVDVAQDQVATVDVPVAPDVVVQPDVPVDAVIRTRGHMNFVPPEVHPTAAARLIVLGDSISTGTGASRTALKYYNLLASNDSTSWPMEMGHDLAAFFHLDGGSLPVVNVAVGGATTITMAANQPGALRTALSLPAAGHSVVVITIGGNDLQSAIISGDPAGLPLTRAIANIRTTVQFLQDPANFPDGTSIYLAAVYDPSDGEGLIRGCFFNLSLPEFVIALDTWRASYITLGTELHFAVVDALGHFHGHGWNFDHPANPYFDAADPTKWFSDCIHPNDRGHSELRRIFYEAIDPTVHVTD